MEAVYQRLRSNASRARHLLEITSLLLFLHALFPSVFFELFPLGQYFTRLNRNIQILTLLSPAK